MLKIFFVWVALAVGMAVCAKLEDAFKWKQVTYAWPDEKTKEEFLKSGAYVPYNNLPLGLARWKDKLFVTVPRWRAGVPATLTYVPLTSKDQSPDLVPYPDLKANTLPKEGEKLAENQIISTFRVHVDECDRLWVMDTGIVDLHGSPKVYSKATIIVFDLKTDKVLRRYELKPSDVKEDSFFANIVIDSQPDKCDESYAYIPDLGGFGLVVYSWKNNDSYRIKHNYFHFDPLSSDMTIAGVNLQWTDGLFGLALSKLQPDGYRTLYFHPMLSTKEFSVPTDVIQNQTVATDSHSFHLFKVEGDKGPNSQTSSSYMDKETGVLFLTQVQKDGFSCWNTKKPLKPENVALVAQDKEALIFTNELQVDEERNLWAFSNRMPLYNYKQLNPEEYNYRIFKIKVDDAIAGTVCAN